MENYAVFFNAFYLWYNTSLFVTTWLISMAIQWNLTFISNNEGLTSLLPGVVLWSSRHVNHRFSKAESYPQSAARVTSLCDHYGLHNNTKGQGTFCWWQDQRVREKQSVMFSLLAPSSVKLTGLQDLGQYHVGCRRFQMTWVAVGFKWRGLPKISNSELTSSCGKNNYRIIFYCCD